LELRRIEYLVLSPGALTRGGLKRYAHKLDNLQEYLP
jgi:hypothetical protein